MSVWSSQRGITLIELVLVIILISVLGVVASVSLQNLATVRLSYSVDKVVSDLRHAQQLAIATQNRHGLTVNSALQYTVHVDNAGVDSPITSLQSSVIHFDNYQQGQLSGVRFSSLTPFCTGPPACATCGSVVEFNSVGRPTDTAGTVLCSGTITLNYSGNTRTITITPETGNLTY